LALPPTVFGASFRSLCTSTYPSEYGTVHPIIEGLDSVKISDELLIPAGRHTLQPDEVSARQRERLLRAMGRCVSERGYAETTIADVVRCARTSRSVFYKHFADKEECFLETYRQMTEVRIAASLAAAAEVSEWDAKLDLGIAAYFRWMAEHPEVAVTTVVEVHSAGRLAQEARSRALADWTRTVEGVAVLARNAGVEVRIDETAAFAIILTAEAYVHEYARKRRLDEVVEKTEAVQALARALFERGRVSSAGAA
jgi:AcrR family transcriptional regulator